MNRRNLIKSGVVLLFPGSFAPPVQAFVAPVIIRLAGVAIFVAFKKYIVDGMFVKALARWLPSLFATDLRKYLFAVLLAFGISEAKAALLAEEAEENGAKEVARDEKERITDIYIKNVRNEPLEISGLRLLLVDAQTNMVELRSTASWGLVVFPGQTMKRQIVARKYPTVGLKYWCLSTEKETLAVSERFMVV
jgi:hypothetical protein